VTNVPGRDTAPRPSPAAIALDALADRQHAATEVVRRQTSPWWMAAPAIFAYCLHLVETPIRLFNLAVETAVSLAVVAVVWLCFLIYAGDIPQEKVVGFLKPVGKKVVDMMQSSAAPSQTPPQQ
jgi:hypothetical protein